MAYSRILIIVEGLDDENFVREVLKPVLQDKWQHVETYQWSQKSKKSVLNMIKSVEGMNSSPGEKADYLFMADIDSEPCITAKKRAIARRFGKKIRPDRIVVVVKEIEGWYWCGLRAESCEELGVAPDIGDTDDMSKEKFERLTPARSTPRLLRVQILNRYDLAVARRRNRSLEYLLKKCAAI